MKIYQKLLSVLLVGAMVFFLSGVNPLVAGEKEQEPELRWVYYECPGGVGGVIVRCELTTSYAYQSCNNPFAVIYACGSGQ